jgi:hypothetical protein
MDTMELVALGSGIAGALTGGGLAFVLGLRVCGPRIQIEWTERHPREIAEEIRSGKSSMRQLTPRSQRLVLAELARMGNGLPLEASAEFITPTGVGGRFVGQNEPRWAHRTAD